MVKSCLVVEWLHIQTASKYSGDRNNEHQNKKHVLVRYSDVQYLMLVGYSNGSQNTRLDLVWYPNGIQIPDHLEIRQLLTIRISD